MTDSRKDHGVNNANSVKSVKGKGGEVLYYVEKT